MYVDTTCLVGKKGLRWMRYMNDRGIGEGERKVNKLNQRSSARTKKKKKTKKKVMGKGMYTKDTRRREREVRCIQ
jgi:hypothetical protein